MALGDRQRAAARDRANANRPSVVGRGDGTGRQDYTDARSPTTTDLNRTTVSPPVEERAQRTGAHDFTAATRAAIAERSRGSCEARVSARCVGLASHVHHRLLRRFGDHSAENGLFCCVMCHMLIHARPKQAYATGMMVRSTDDPAATDVSPGVWSVLG